MRRRFLFSLHVVGIATTCVFAVLLHLRASSNRLAELKREMRELRARVVESEKKVVAVQSSESAGFIDDSSVSSWEEPPPVWVLGGGVSGPKWVYIDVRLCDGVTRRIYMHRDKERRSRELDAHIDYLRTLQAWLWSGYSDPSLVSPASVRVGSDAIEGSEDG